MRRIACSLLTLAALALPARGQSVEVPATLKVDEPGFVTVVATKTDADALRWFAVGSPRLQPLPPNVPPPPLGTYVGFTLSPGVYKLGVIPAKAGKDGKAAIGEPQYVVITVGTPPPAPPTPGPNPPGPNPPTSAKLFVVVVEETAAQAADRGRLFTDPALNARFKDKGHRWRIVDKDVVDASGQPPADIKGYLQAAAGKALPQVFLVTSEGRLLFQGDCPRQAADLLTLVQKWGG